MKNYVVYTETGRIVSVGVCSDGELGLQAQGNFVMEGEANHLNDYVDAGVILPLPPKPTEFHQFNYTTKQWTDPRTLADLKAARRAYVNTARLTANQTYFTHEGKQIAADPLSRGDIDAINGEVNNTGGFPAGWPGAWKCLDNTWLPVTTIAQWKALYTSMVNQGTVNFAHAQDLKGQIDAATTPEQVAAISW